MIAGAFCPRKLEAIRAARLTRFAVTWLGWARKPSPALAVVVISAQNPFGWGADGSSAPAGPPPRKSAGRTRAAASAPPARYLVQYRVIACLFSSHGDDGRIEREAARRAVER